MKAEDIMTPNPACCAPDTSLQEVAQMMVDCDCGEIPVVERNSFKPVGVITDRDITIRSIAKGRNPLELKAKDCMTTSPVFVKPDASIDECSKVMEKNQIRRLLVVDGQNKVCGIISQADLALDGPRNVANEVVKAVSRPRGAQESPRV